jgi:uncharacterized lipoprotein YbaY/heat shock protein HslJ
MFRAHQVLIGLSLAFVSLNCGFSSAVAVASPILQMLEITGEITYRERIALPAQSTAVVELRDTSIADAPSGLVAEQRIDPAGRQVPLPFRLSVDRAKLSAARRYSVRATIVGSDRQLLWTTTEAHLIDPTAEKASLGTLMMTRVSSAPSASAPNSSTLTATGNEPGWRLEIGAREMTLLLKNENRVVVTKPEPEVSGDTKRFITTANGRPLNATVTNRRCSDTMTGMPFPYTVVVLFDGQEFKGCGGKPEELLQGAEWIIESLNGVAIPAGGARGTLRFDSNGTVSGKSFCNMFTGTYALTGETLTISPRASMLMACLPDAENQERQFNDLLGTVKRFEITEDGSLVLHTSDQRTIKARRQ